MADQAQVAGALREYDIDASAVPQAIVLCCSDPRFQGAFERFLREELHLEKGQYIPLVVGGGAGVLAHPERLPKEFKFVRERLVHYRLSVFPTARRLILINHQGCRYYQGLQERALGYRVMQERAHDRHRSEQEHGQGHAAGAGDGHSEHSETGHLDHSQDGHSHHPPELSRDSLEALFRQEHDDLAAVATIFARLLPHLDLALEPYFARFTDDQENKIVFEKVGRGA
jgi:hypothetical protein